jgi:photosystem II stability/assembly factor-like uncharacterized protein
MNTWLKITGLSLFIASLVLCFTSCDDDNNIEYEPKLTEFQVDEDISIVDIEFVSDEVGLLCGGEKNDFGSIYKSVDGGETWVRTFRSDTLSVNDIFFLNDSVVFACGDSLMLLKSIDCGDSWETLVLSNLPWEAYYVPYNCIYANDESNIFAVGGEHYNKGLLSETESGNSDWIHTSYDNQFNAICFLSEYVGFIAGYGILLVTEDGGNNFDYIDLEGNDFVDLETDKYNTIYALSENGFLFSSSDLGYNWNTEISSYQGGLNDMHFNESLGIVCGNNGVIYRKENGEYTWTKLKDITDYNLHSVFVKSNGEVLIGAENGKVLMLDKKRVN